jgi:DNA-binding MarR family transcriptional regulator
VIFGARDELERELTRLLRRARATSTALAREVHPDLDAAGYVVLQWLLERGEDGVRASDLAGSLQLHKSTASRAVAELERLGLIERAVDPADGRARLLRLSAHGRTEVQRLRSGRRTHLADRLTRWEAADLHQLAVLLGRLNDDLD